MRDKLIELLEKAESAVYWDSTDQSFVNKIADFLVANGVTIADGNNVGGKKPVLYSVTRGALCPACDGNLDVKVTVKKFLRKEKRFTLRQQSNCCKHCGQPLDWGNEPPKEGE
jgi:hypothetical protein